MTHWRQNRSKVIGDGEQQSVSRLPGTEGDTCVIR